MSSRPRQPSGCPDDPLNVVAKLVLILFLQHVLSRHLRIAATLLALGIVVSLFLGGAQPVAVNLVPEPWDKLLHGIVFALLAWALGFASGFHARRSLSVAFFGSLLIGLLDEWHQLYLPGRQAGWPDFVADMMGSLIGTVSLTLWNRKRG
jgi:VanZ family protein